MASPLKLGALAVLLLGCSREVATPAVPTLGANALIYERSASTARQSAPEALAIQPAPDFAVGGLVEIPQPTGGAIVDLKGRFRHQMSATVPETGKLQVGCEGVAGHEPRQADAR